jgi:hypothetical protein
VKTAFAVVASFIVGAGLFLGAVWLARLTYLVAETMPRLTPVQRATANTTEIASLLMGIAAAPIAFGTIALVVFLATERA